MEIPHFYSLISFRGYVQKYVINISAFILPKVLLPITCDT